MGPFLRQNPGIGGLDELTPAEEIFLTSLAGLSYALGDILYYDGSKLNTLNIGATNEILKVIAGLPSWVANFWDRNGTIVTPHGATDDIKGTRHIILKAGCKLIFDGN